MKWLITKILTGFVIGIGFTLAIALTNTLYPGMFNVNFNFIAPPFSIENHPQNTNAVQPPAELKKENAREAAVKVDTMPPAPQKINNDEPVVLLETTPIENEKLNENKIKPYQGPRIRYNQYDNEQLDQLYEKAQKYRWGYGVSKNMKEAFKWYLEAAEKGHVKSQVEVGQMYSDGYGVEQNYSAALWWYREAANKGNKSAEGTLGWMYLNGYGTDIDYRAAYEHLSVAAKSGESFAMANLGWMYQKGIYVQQNDSMAQEWYTKGKAAGDDFSIRQLRNGW